MTDGAEGERFLIAFNALKAETGDDPSALSASWESSERLRQLSDEIHALVRGFEIEEEWSPLAFTPHVTHAGALARREYDQRWRKSVSEVADREWRALFAGILDFGLDDQPSPSRDKLGADIEDWKESGRIDAGHIDQIIDHAFYSREVDDSDDFDWVDRSLQAWDRLKVAGLKLDEAMWRRRAIPHVLIPTHVARHYGANGASLYRRLHQAGQAFVFGAPLAALALQRAVLEEVLKKHWGADGGAVRNADLPELSWGIRADRLKRLGNEALHNDPERQTAEQLDRSIIENFLLLRLLIEHAPANLKPTTTGTN